MSSLEPHCISNAGQTCKLLREAMNGHQVSLYYEAGIQWHRWRDFGDVIVGRGINRQIRRAYGFLASRYRPGDRIFLFGYSRGAYAVRSLAGLIDRVGLLRANEATVRNIRTAYRHYQCGSTAATLESFVRRHCHEHVAVEMLGIWDTVKALGLRLPLLWRMTVPAHAFHNHNLGPHIRHGFHALALQETRVAYAPVLWETGADDWPGHVEQVWFPGSHGDVGGQLRGYEPARQLANIPLVWMLERAEVCGLPLPEGWRERFVTNASAPMVGDRRGHARLFLLRRMRRAGADASEALHPSALAVLKPRQWAGDGPPRIWRPAGG